MSLSCPIIFCLNKEQSIKQLSYYAQRLSLLWQKIKWQKLLIKISFWLIAEIYLNLIAIDDLADMSEYILMVFCHQQNKLIQVDILEEKS